MALFCAAIRRDSISLLKFPFLSHVQVLSCEMLFISRLNSPWGCFSSNFCFQVIVILFIIYSFRVFHISVSIVIFIIIIKWDQFLENIIVYEW